MHLYTVVLFLHIAALLCAIALAGLLHATEWLLPRSQTMSEFRALARPQKLGVLFVPIILILLGLGMWLVHLSKKQSEHFSLSNGWVWTAIVALGLLLVSGGGIMGRHATALNKAAEAAPDGPVSPEMRAMATEPLTWAVGYGSTFLAVSVACNMVNKPSAPIAILVLVVGTVIGVTIGLIGSGRARA